MLGFLHTAAVHADNFERLLRERDADVPSRHIVAVELLDAARAAGVTPAVAAQVAQAIGALAADGARVVLCTCSTIGAAAEAAAVGVPVLRLDRPMAEAAVAQGPRIALVAALASTLEPSTALLEEVAARAGRHITVTPVLCDDAWPHFESGDLEAYLAAVARAAQQAAAAHDVVVLAQGSMAPVADRVKAAVPVLSSPRLGIDLALRLYRS
jgi:aspartate/glutamate racemase